MSDDTFFFPVTLISLIHFTVPWMPVVPFLALSFCGSGPLFSQIQGHLGTKATKDSDFAMGTAPSRHIEISEEAGLGV